MSNLPPDHPQRVLLAGEVHARPPERLATPSRASDAALLIDIEARDHEVHHLRTLCKRFDVTGPPGDATHFRAAPGPLRLKWECHGEFSGYPIAVEGLATALDRRAELQLRLQQTVEGLSVAAVVRYAAKAARGAGLRIDPDVAVGMSIPLVAEVVLFALRRNRHRMASEAH
jgi:uncharacterized membrane-anchored protein